MGCGWLYKMMNLLIMMLGGDESIMVSEIDLCFEALESSQDEIWKTIDGLMENQRKMSNIMEEMWRFLKSSASLHGFGSESKGKRNLVKKIEQNVGSMGKVCSAIYSTIISIHMLHCFEIPYKVQNLFFLLDVDGPFRIMVYYHLTMELNRQNNLG